METFNLFVKQIVKIVNPTKTNYEIETDKISNSSCYLFYSFVFFINFLIYI